MQDFRCTETTFIAYYNMHKNKVPRERLKLILYWIILLDLCGSYKSKHWEMLTQLCYLISRELRKVIKYILNIINCARFSQEGPSNGYCFN